MSWLLASIKKVVPFFFSTATHFWKETQEGWWMHQNTLSFLTFTTAGTCVWNIKLLFTLTWRQKHSRTKKACLTRMWNDWGCKTSSIITSPDLNAKLHHQIQWFCHSKWTWHPWNSSTMREGEDVVRETSKMGENLHFRYSDPEPWRLPDDMHSSWSKAEMVLMNTFILFTYLLLETTGQSHNRALLTWNYKC